MARLEFLARAKLGSVSRAELFIRLGLGSVSRAYFFIRLGLGSISRADFLKRLGSARPRLDPPLTYTFTIVHCGGYIQFFTICYLVF